MQKPNAYRDADVHLRLTQKEKERALEEARLTGMSVSEIFRRRLSSARPIIAHADMVMVRELRRIGGLLKHNFETMRQAEMPRELHVLQEATLKNLNSAIEALGEKIHDSQKNQKQAGI